MNFKDLSFREYLAIEFLPAFMRHYSALGGSEDEIAENTAKYAFRYADAFLRVAGKEMDRIAAAEARAEKAETQTSVLLNMGPDFGSRVALLQIWEFLGVKNQTEAMEALRVRQADQS